MKKFFKVIYCLFIFMFVLFIFGCQEQSEGKVLSNGKYEYVVTKNGIRLTKYIGEYRALITVPSIIDGVRVTSVGENCFVRDNNASHMKNLSNSVSEDDNELSDNSTFIIGDNITDIEDGSFDENSTFVTSRTSKLAGWKDDSMTGSAKDGEGNVYYDTKSEDTIVSQGIVYVRDTRLNGLYIARCLTQRKEVIIPSVVKGEKVIDVGREAFSHNDKIEKVTLPNTIGQIYRYAFYNCSNLKEVIFLSANLSKINVAAFHGCSLLDVVKLPQNCTYLASGAFEECGEISKLYIPYSMGKIMESAFSNTTVKEIIYGGTIEQWEKIVIAEDVLEIFKNANISYLTSQESVKLEYINEIYNLFDNTFVEFEGVITGFYGQYGLYVTDPTDNYSVLCYNHEGLEFTDLEYIGKTVKVKGTKVMYTGDIEVSQCEIEVLDLPKTTITPIELDWTDPNLNFDEYLYKYVIIKGMISNIDGRFIFLEGIKINLFYYTTWEDMPELIEGNYIETVGWIHAFNQTVEIMLDSRLIKVKE